MPFFSIIIPVCNVEPYLRECLDSLLSQTDADWEALCVDDGSTDGSGTILDEYAAKDGRFHVIHQPNAGVSAARNAALDMAQGEWVCFLDADDKVESHWLEDIAQGAKQHPEVDWIRTSFRNWVDGMEPQPWPEGSVHRHSERVFEDVLFVAWEMLSHNGAPWVNIYKRKMTQGIRYIVGLKYSEDICFTLDYMKNSLSSHKLLTISNDDYRYRKRISSANGNMCVGDVLDSFGLIISKWNGMRGRSGAFTPAIERHVRRCITNGHPMTRSEASRLKVFLWKASKLAFFSPFFFASRKKAIRWVLFMMIGNPKILFGKAGWNWFVPYTGSGVTP